MIAVIQVLVIAILIAVGYRLAKKEIFTPKTGKELSYLLVNIVTPALILNSFQIDYTPEKLQGLLITGCLAFFSYAIVIIFSHLYCGRRSDVMVDRLCLVFSNVGFMGLPLISGMYGSEGTFYASIMVIVFNFTFWTYGITVMRGSFSKDSLRRVLLSPIIFAVLVGLVLFFFHWKLPDPFYSVCKHLASLNTPIAMMVAGISISQSDIPALFKKPKLYKLLAGKLILAPLLVALVFLTLPVNPMIKEILVIQIACPTAATVGIAMIQCGKDNRSATEYFTLTTLVSMVTIPLIKFFCQWIFH